jgi:hypothetical protein
MPAPRSRDLTIVLAGGAVIVALAVAVAIVLPPGNDSLPEGSSYSVSGAGSAAAYRTLDTLGYHLRRSVEPLTSLNVAPASTLLVLIQPIEAASTQDRRALQQFVAAGGTVLATGCGGASFLTGRDQPSDNPFVPANTYRAVRTSPLSEGAPAIRMALECDTQALASEFQPLYAADKVAAVRIDRVGKGLIAWWAGSTPITNAAIDEEGHLDLLLNLAGAPGRTIVWDEFYHGQRRSLWSYTSRTPLRWAFAQAALVLIVAASIYARRRAPIRGRYVEPRTSPLEFVDTMAGLYARAPTASAAVALARTRLRRRMIAVTGLSADATDAHLAAAAAPRLRRSTAELQTMLETADRAGHDSATTPEAALPLVRALQTIAATIPAGG